MLQEQEQQEPKAEQVLQALLDLRVLQEQEQQEPKAEQVLQALQAQLVL